MRLTAPELAARYREGMVTEGSTVVDVQGHAAGALAVKQARPGVE